jgi:uncharacterized coiled-coil protein SlyX
VRELVAPQRRLHLRERRALWHVDVLLGANVARVVASVTRTARIVALEAHAATQAKRAAALRRAIATQSHAVALTRKESLTDRIVELRASSASTTQQTRVATATLEAATERASSADADQDGESAAVNTVAIQLRCVRLEAKVSSLMQQQRSTTSIRRKAEERLSGAQMSLAAATCMHADSIAAVRSADRCAAYVAGIVDDHSRSRCASAALACPSRTTKSSVQPTLARTRRGLRNSSSITG